MPLHLEPIDIFEEIKDLSSVLIVSCPVCPPISLAIQKDSPFIELFKHGIKTPAFEDHIQSMRERLEHRGVRTGVFCMYAPCPTMCLWTSGQRRRLFKRAKGYDAVVVLGCETAGYTAQQALKESDCRVILAMQMTGLTNAAVKFQFPMTVTLQHKTLVGEGRSSVDSISNAFQETSTPKA